MKNLQFCLISCIAILILQSTVATGQDAAAGKTEDLQITALKTRIETSRFTESIYFYHELLGMHILETWDEGKDKGVILALANLADGQALLELAHDDRSQNLSGISLQFRIHDIDAVADKLRGRWEFSGPAKRPWGSIYLYLTDPSGIQVIIYEGEM